MLPTASAPFDGQNINAAFPGSVAAGSSLTDRQAAACWELVTAGQFHIDFRGGDLSGKSNRAESSSVEQRAAVQFCFGLCCGVRCSISVWLLPAAACCCCVLPPADAAAGDRVTFEGYPGEVRVI